MYCSGAFVAYPKLYKRSLSSLCKSSAPVSQVSDLTFLSLPSPSKTVAKVFEMQLHELCL